MSSSSSSSYHQVNTAAERARLLKEMLQIQAQIRTKKEKERLIKTNQNNHYSRMFEPVTKTMEKLSSKPAVPVVDDLIDLKEPVMRKKEENDTEIEEEEEEEEEGKSLFDSVLQTIPTSLRDDGIFGLNVHTRCIGSHDFQVINDDLLVVDEVKSYRITDPDLWRLLLVKRPNSIKLKLKSGKKYKLFVRDYKRMVDELDLVDFAYAKYGDRKETREKFKLLQDLERTTTTTKSGSGFLFSVQPPPFFSKKCRRRRGLKSSTVVIPSDKKGLLRALYQAVAELRAGNTSMRNLVVPLAQEAKRKKILPPHLLSVDERNWVFS